MSNYVEYRLVNSVWVEQEMHDSKSRRQLMKKLVKGDPDGENETKKVVQRKVRKA